MPNAAPPRLSAPSAFAGLFALELRRLLRGWRWRAVVLLDVVVALLMARSVPSFGEGSTAFFPGATLGIRALGLLFAAAALVLAVDLAGEADHRRARQALDPRPLSGLLLQLVRLAAVAASLAAPNVALFAFFFLPALLAPPAAGLAARTLTRNDAAAATLGIVLLAPWYWFAFVACEPERLFLSASRILGLLVPPTRSCATSSSPQRPPASSSPSPPSPPECVAPRRRCAPSIRRASRPCRCSRLSRTPSARAAASARRASPSPSCSPPSLFPARRASCASPSKPSHCPRPAPSKPTGVPCRRPPAPSAPSSTRRASSAAACASSPSPTAASRSC